MKDVRPLSPEETELFNSHYETYYKTIFSLARHIVGDPNIAEVVAQETFITAWQKFDQFQSSENPPGWLVIVAKNKCKQALRDRKKYLDRNLPLLESAALTVEYDFDHLDPLIPEMPEQELLRRYYEEGYTIRELAQAEKANISTIKMRLKRARDKLKKEIQKK